MAASSGIGLEVARQLAGRGMTVEYPVTTEGGRGA
jgi:NAD(P)-dependent dehydrogenase (short-subunit alcohol dehydrogenase family)